MSQKVEKTRAGAATLVGPGETVRHAVPVQIGPSMAMALGPLGVVLLKFRTVALTDAALYVMTKSAVGNAPKAVERRIPRGSVAVSTKKGPGFASTLFVGDQKMLVTVGFKEEAAQLAAAASVRSAGVTQ